MTSESCATPKPSSREIRTISVIDLLRKKSSVDNQDDFRTSFAHDCKKKINEVELASLIHVMQWSENAENVKKKMRDGDEKLIKQLNCCCRKLLQCCCPGFSCCRQGRVPIDPKKPSLLSTSSTYVRHFEQLYSCCFCFRCRLTLGTSLFIWWDFPFAVTKDRLVMIFQTCSQCLALVFNWVFVYDMVIAPPKSNDRKIRISKEVLNTVLIVFWLPDIFHAFYMFMVPGYREKSCKRKTKQAVYSLLSPLLVRPLYAMTWSLRWTQLMPFSKLQNEGDIVTDSGVHERELIWAGLSVTLRELPLLALKCYVLMDYWAFWGRRGKDWVSMSEEAVQGGTLRHCGGIVNEWTVLASFALGLLMGAFSLSDQLEREVPYGSYPKRFSRVLRGDPCGSPALLWTATFMVAFFLDLSLKFLIIVPMSILQNFSYSWLLMFFWFLQSCFLCWWFLTERSSSSGSSNRSNRSSRSSSRSSRSSRSSNSTNELRVKSESFGVSDNYDKGVLMQTLSLEL